MSENIKELIHSKAKDELDKRFLLKKFLKTVFRDVDFTTEQVRCLRINKKGIAKEQYSNNIDYIVEYSFRNESNWNNSYFQLCTTNGTSGKKEDLLYRYCLGFDFDKNELGENFNHKDIINRFKELKIYCHSIIDTGNGYHAYVMLNKTSDLNKVREVQKVLAEKLGADLKAVKDTQVLRLPFTFNIKDDFPKTVNLLHLEEYDSDVFRAYDIDFLYQKNVLRKKEEVRDKVINDSTTKHILLNTNIPNCIAEKLVNGSAEGERFDDLCNIVVALRNGNKSLSQIKAICKEWAEKSNYDDNLMYRVEGIYNNKKYLKLNCSNCSKNNNECFSVMYSNFEYSEKEQIITVSETVMSKLKESNRKGAKFMKSNDLLVYGVLKNHNDGLTIEELKQELTYTKKKEVINVALSDKTLRSVLKSLEENEFIEVVKESKKNIYVLKKIRSKAELMFDISFSATYECIKGNISTEELRLYNYMRYLHHKKQREDTKALKGNLFQINQSEIAKDLGVTQVRISQMISNLLDEKLLSIWYRGRSKNNSFEYNVYRLNY